MRLDPEDRKLAQIAAVGVGADLAPNAAIHGLRPFFVVARHGFPFQPANSHPDEWFLQCSNAASATREYGKI